MSLLLQPVRVPPAWAYGSMAYGSVDLPYQGTLDIDTINVRYRIVAPRFLQIKRGLYPRACQQLLSTISSPPRHTPRGPNPFHRHGMAASARLPSDLVASVHRHPAGAAAHNLGVLAKAV